MKKSNGERRVLPRRVAIRSTNPHLDSIDMSIEIARRRDLARERGEPVPSVQELERQLEIEGMTNAARDGKSSWTLDDLARKPMRHDEWFIDRLLGPGITFFGAKHKDGKTVFSMQALIAIAGGSEFLGRRTRQCSVLYLSYDEPDEDVLKQQSRPFFEANLPFQFETGWPLLDEGGLGKLIQAVEANPRIGVIAIDTFQASLKQRIGNDYWRNSRLIAELWGRISALGRPIAIVLLHHLIRARRGVAWDEQMYGSNGLAAGARCIWHLARPSTATPEEGPYAFHAKGRTMRGLMFRLMRSNHVFLEGGRTGSGDSHAFSWVLDPLAPAGGNDQNPTDLSIIRVLQGVPNAIREVDLVALMKEREHCPHTRQYIAARANELARAGVIAKNGYPYRWLYAMRKEMKARVGGRSTRIIPKRRTSM